MRTSPLSSLCHPEMSNTSEKEIDDHEPQDANRDRLSFLLECWVFQRGLLLAKVTVARLSRTAGMWGYQS